MNRSVFKQGGAGSWCCAMFAGLVLLSWATPVAGGEKQPVQSVGIPLSYTPGEMNVTPGGTVHMRGFTLVYALISEDPLINGRLTATGNFDGDISLNGTGSGFSLHELGTWNFSSEPPVFTPSTSGGLWAAKWEHKGIFAGMSTIKAVGHGIAGEVEDMTYVVEGEASGSVLYTGWLLDPNN